MATDVDICNMGLSMLGTNLIATFNDGTTEANLCQLHYPNIRDAVLGARAWTFATTRKELASGTPPDPIPAGWGYAFLAPTDCIRVIQIYTPNPAGAVVQYVTEQFDALYSNFLGASEELSLYKPRSYCLGKVYSKNYGYFAVRLQFYSGAGYAHFSGLGNSNHQQCGYSESSGRAVRSQGGGCIEY